MHMTDRKTIILRVVAIATIIVIITLALVISLVHVRVITPPGLEVDMGRVRVISARQMDQCPGNHSFNCNEAYVISVITMINANQGRELVSLNIPLQQ